MLTLFRASKNRCQTWSWWRRR